MWLGSHFEKSEFPSSHHREEGWRRHQEKGAKPPYGRRRGGVPCPSDRNTTPSSRKADAAQYFLDRSATPPRGDARRGIRHFENSPQLGQQCLEGGDNTSFEFIQTVPNIRSLRTTDSGAAVEAFVAGAVSYRQRAEVDKAGRLAYFY